MISFILTASTDAPLGPRHSSGTVSAAGDRTLTMREVRLAKNSRTRRTVGIEPAALPTLMQSANARKAVELTDLLTNPTEKTENGFHITRFLTNQMA